MAKLALCVSVMLVLLVALGESSPLCCTSYRENPVPVNRLKYYVVQEDTGFCNIKAVIFKNIKNKAVCANPDADWVKQAMEVVPERRRA